MKFIIVIIDFIFLSSLSFGQVDTSKYYFDEIGMTIHVPSEFHLQNPKPKSVYLDQNLQPITDTQKLKELTVDEPKTLLEIESKDQKNSMSITITPISEMFLRTFGDSAHFFDMSLKAGISRIKEEGGKIETPFSKIKIDTLIFYEFFSSYKVRDQKFYEGGYVAKLNNYYLGVKIDYEDEKVGIALKKIIETAIFK